MGLEVCLKSGGLGIVNFLPGQGSVRDVLVFQVGLVGLADIAGGAEQEDHGGSGLGRGVGSCGLGGCGQRIFRRNCAAFIENELIFLPE